MRMISRREAVEMLSDHNWRPNECTAAHCEGENLNTFSSKCKTKYYLPCSSFNTSLGNHDQYAVIDVKNWLGY